MKRFALASTAAMLAVAMPAQAEMISAKDPAAIAAIVQGEELRAIVHTPETEPPYIESELDGVPFAVFFDNCDDAFHNCKTAQFYMGFNDAKSTTLERLNEWNRDSRFTRAFRDEQGDPVMQMDLDLDFDGLPKANVIEALNIWLDSMEKFRNYILPPDEK